MRDRGDHDAAILVITMRGMRMMFGACGAECRQAEPGDDATEDPWSLLGKSLDALVADGLLAAERRPGAELKAWSVVHGFASLALDGLASMPTAADRARALEALLEFTVVGLCAQTPAWGDSR